MKSYKIHLIRHGRTQANEEGLYVGRTDLPLSPGGLNALLALREGGGYPTAGRFFTSPLTRCRQTLEVLYPGCRQEVVEGLAECDFGRWEGRSAASLQQDASFRDWIAGKRAEIPEGEDAAVFQRRVTAAFEELVRELMRAGDTQAVVCTHGGVIMTLLTALGLPKREPKLWMTGNGRGYTVATSAQLWSQGQVVEVFDPLPYDAMDIDPIKEYNLIDLVEDEKEG